jgi:hypothetical protein
MCYVNIGYLTKKLSEMLFLVRGKNKRIFTTRSSKFTLELMWNVSNRLLDKNLVTICVWREHHTTIWNGTCFVSSAYLLRLVSHLDSLKYNNRRHRVPFCGSHKLARGRALRSSTSFSILLCLECSFLPPYWSYPQ